MYSIDTDGWLSDVTRRPSTNYNQRPFGHSIDLLVIHNISLPAGCFGTGYIEQLFCNTLDCSVHADFADLLDLRVSAHLLIDRRGEVIQFVSFLDRAWHAGVSHYAGRDNCNDFSIGIELEGCDNVPYTDLQYQQLQRVTDALIKRFPLLTPERIVGHCDVAPGRKTDPGPAFDWHRYLQYWEC